MNKLYFSDEINPEFAYTKTVLLSTMKDMGYESICIYEAKRELHVNYFYCIYYHCVGMKDDEFSSCGKMCKDYKPRNGRSGCCQHRGYCYERGKMFTLFKNGKLINYNG